MHVPALVKLSMTAEVHQSCPVASVVSSSLHMHVLNEVTIIKDRWGTTNQRLHA